MSSGAEAKRIHTQAPTIERRHTLSRFAVHARVGLASLLLPALLLIGPEAQGGASKAASLPQAKPAVPTQVEPTFTG